MLVVRALAIALVLVPLARSAAAADPLATKVAARAGNPYAEPGLAFTFAVDGGPTRSHRWDIPGGRVQVRWSGEQGACEVVTTVPYAGDDPLQKEAWGLFVNDQYWLLAPSKVLDAGVTATSEGDTLSLAFEGVGLTPGDRYTLTVDPATGDVVRWSFLLQSGRSGTFTWSPPEQVGGLWLSLERHSPEGRVIRFSGVESRAQSVGEPGGTCTPARPATP